MRNSSILFLAAVVIFVIAIGEIVYAIAYDYENVSGIGNLGFIFLIGGFICDAVEGAKK